MRKLNCTQFGDLLIDCATDHCGNLEQRIAEGKDITADIEFYNKDILEIVGEARRMISHDNLGNILDFVRENVNFYDLMK